MQTVCLDITLFEAAILLDVSLARTPHSMQHTDILGPVGDAKEAVNVQRAGQGPVGAQDRGRDSSAGGTAAA